LVDLQHTRLGALVRISSLDQTTSLLKATIAGAKDDEAAILRHSLVDFVSSSNVDAGVRYGMAAASLPNSASGSFDAVVVEAVQAALVKGAPNAVTLATTALTNEGEQVRTIKLMPDHISDDALSTVLALVCTSLHDNVEALLSGEGSKPELEPACQLLASYAEKHLADLLQSDIQLQALVATHHATALVPRIQAGPGVPAASTIWKQCQTLSDPDAEKLQAAVLSSLISLLHTTGRIR